MSVSRDYWLGQKPDKSHLKEKRKLVCEGFIYKTGNFKSGTQFNP